jgi:hypothetical protein
VIDGLWGEVARNEPGLSRHNMDLAGSRSPGGTLWDPCAEQRRTAGVAHMLVLERNGWHRESRRGKRRRGIAVGEWQMSRTHAEVRRGEGGGGGSLWGLAVAYPDIEGVRDVRWKPCW